MDPLQRKFGYAFGYDASALGMSMVIDCEPIFFDYNGKHWMIELWKGQYGLETGSEVGVYTRPIGSTGPGYALLDATVGQRPGDSAQSHNLFYDCASNDDKLMLQSTLKKDGQVLFTRGPELHWWLTGFKWGVFSHPDELTLDAAITLKDQAMLRAFQGGIAGRNYSNLKVDGTTVSFTLEQPFAVPQPPRPGPVLSSVEAWNHEIVSKYNSLGFPNTRPERGAGRVPQRGGPGDAPAPGLLRAERVPARGPARSQPRGGGDGSNGRAEGCGQYGRGLVERRRAGVRNMGERDRELPRPASRLLLLRGGRQHEGRVRPRVDGQQRIVRLVHRHPSDVDPEGDGRPFHPPGFEAERLWLRRDGHVQVLRQQSRSEERHVLVRGPVLVVQRQQGLLVPGRLGDVVEDRQERSVGQLGPDRWPPALRWLRDRRRPASLARSSAEPVLHQGSC